MRPEDLPLRRKRYQRVERGTHSDAPSTAIQKRRQQHPQTDGQRLFLERMIRHHQGAIKMAQAEIASGKNPNAITLAKNIAESQQAEVDTMTELLNKI
jgi:uncharacterized protein (DUF305 family)